MKNSEQQLVECSAAESGGCSGGWEHEAWQYLASNGRQTDESSYPYTATVGNVLFQFFGHDDRSSSFFLKSRRMDRFTRHHCTMMTVLAGGERILSVYMQLPNTFFNYK